MGVYKTNIEVNGVEDVPAAVRYVHCRAIKGSREGGTGLPLEPDEPEHIEIESVTLGNGQEITLTTRQERSMEDEIAEWLMGRYDEPEPY